MSLLPGAPRALHQKPLVPGSFYWEPYWVTRYLLEYFEFPDPIHDPCCGSGRIIKVCREYGHLDATGSDLFDRGFGQTGVDFFTDDTVRKTLMSNPPGGGRADPELATRFVMHMLRVAEVVAAFVGPSFMCGDGRRDHMFLPCPPDWILPVVPRPSCPPGGTDIEARGGTADYAWFLWGAMLRPRCDPPLTRVFWPPKDERIDAWAQAERRRNGGAT